MAHGEFLREASDDPDLASHVMHDYRNADLDAETRAMLDFATKLTREPAAQGLAGVVLAKKSRGTRRGVPRRKSDTRG